MMEENELSELNRQTNPEIERFNEMAESIRSEMGKVIVGQRKGIDLLLAGFFSGGHVLLEGVPGIAKTLMAKMLANTVSVNFSRIQFTPDLMPADIIGTSVFNMKNSEFNFNKGPLFSNIVLIDEINRSPAKTQAALFEVMEELQITVDGKTHPMDFPFFVIATQNPVEQEGTYKLPEAQLDRFIFKIRLGYPDAAEEREILNRFKEDFRLSNKTSVKGVLGAAELKTCFETVEKVFISDELLDYIVKITGATRQNGDIFLGASPRASLSILRTAKAMAAMNGRDFVMPEDIKEVAVPVLNHRIILTPEKEMEGVLPENIINSIIQNIELPR